MISVSKKPHSEYFFAGMFFGTWENYHDLSTIFQILRCPVKVFFDVPNTFNRPQKRQVGMAGPRLRNIHATLRTSLVDPTISIHPTMSKKNNLDLGPPLFFLDEHVLDNKAATCRCLAATRSINLVVSFSSDVLPSIHFFFGLSISRSAEVHRNLIP